MGGVESRVTNNITNDEEVKVQNSNLKTTKVYKDITLSAADDLKLFTYAYSEFSTGAWGGADAIVKNNLTRNNKINLLSGSDLYSLQDVNLYAGKNADGSVATLDLDAEASDFVGSVLPITLKPTVTNNIQQNNQITVDASSASTSVRHTNLYASTGREMARTTSGRYVGIYYTNRDSKFVTTDNGVSRCGFCSEDTYQWSSRCVPCFDFKILMDQIKQVKLLALIFMESFDLNVIQKLRR